MASAISHNHQFHTCFAEATQLLQQHQLQAALATLLRARRLALQVSEDPVLAANGQQNYVTTSLIMMGVQFRLHLHADTLATYHQLFHQLDDWLGRASNRACQIRLRGYQTLAERACRHLHLERLREETINAQSNP